MYFIPTFVFSTSSGFWKLCLTEDSSRRRLKLVENYLGTTHVQASRNKGILTLLCVVKSLCNTTISIQYQ